MADKTFPSVWMQELTWQEVSSYLEGGGRVALIPCGTTEQHGPVGPLGLDAYVAIALSEDAAKKTGVLVTPPLWLGDSSHHTGFPGTLSIHTETLSAVIKDVCRSLARHGFDRILLINGHKGTNLPALTTAVRNLHEDELPGVLFAVADPLHLARKAAGEIKETNEHHAGELEVSHILYKFPHLIREDKKTSKSVDFGALFGGFVGDDLFGPAPEGVEIAWSSDEQRAFTPEGNFSSSELISKEKGKAYHDHMVGRLCAVIEWMKTYDGPIGKGGGKR